MPDDFMIKTGKLASQELRGSCHPSCLMPSCHRLLSLSPSRIKSKRSLVGRPGPRDLSENMAATQGLSHMISDCKKLFQVSQERLWYRLSELSGLTFRLCIPGLKSTGSPPVGWDPSSKFLSPKILTLQFITVIRLQL